jgi:hypothetical protein
MVVRAALYGLPRTVPRHLALRKLEQLFVGYYRFELEPAIAQLG